MSNDVGQAGRDEPFILAPSLRPDFNAAVHEIYVPEGPLVYDPDGWKGVWANCYSYALGLKQRGWGYPGQLLYKKESEEDFPIKEMTVEGVRRRVLEDDLLLVNDVEDVNSDAHLIAAFVQAGYGLHFYRRDEGGFWSHKLESFPVMNRDTDGRLIENVIDAPKVLSDQFVGYFRVPDQGIGYYPRF